VFEKDLERFKGRLYRLLMVVMTPQGMLRAAGKRWEAFHRGTTLAVQAARGHAVGVLRFPEWLYLPDSKINMCGSFRAALTACGANHPVVQLTDATPTEHIFEATWR
jgi:hypothetical protein